MVTNSQQEGVWCQVFSVNVTTLNANRSIVPALQNENTSLKVELSELRGKQSIQLYIQLGRFSIANLGQDIQTKNFTTVKLLNPDLPNSCIVPHVTPYLLESSCIRNCVYTHIRTVPAIPTTVERCTV